MKKLTDSSLTLPLIIVCFPLFYLALSLFPSLAQENSPAPSSGTSTNNANNSNNASNANSTNNKNNSNANSSQTRRANSTNAPYSPYYIDVYKPSGESLGTFGTLEENVKEEEEKNKNKPQYYYIDDEEKLESAPLAPKTSVEQSDGTSPSPLADDYWEQRKKAREEEKIKKKEKSQAESIHYTSPDF